MTTISYLQSLSAEELTALGYILALSLSRSITKEDLLIVGLLIDNVGDVIETIAAIEAIQARDARGNLDTPNDRIPEEQKNETTTKEQQNLDQVIDDFREIIKSFREIIDDLQNQTASLRQEIRELQNKFEDSKGRFS
ncbi:hypothetical protein [Sporomusa sp.]|uniref:hypothetical protein n=1 Tax=Sporomusa sp. TaxID=2078658 RepID=UPI002C7E72D8|nr:hypothetical protein [Sporomusa sp.]HWR43386.1 hypothetical protein [Sporomusa sp.]